MTMKPFDLEKALAGEPVVTKDGDKVIELKHYPSASQDDYCISGIIISENSSFVETFLINGQLVKGMTACGNDLMMFVADEWVNVYYNKTTGVYGSSIGTTYPSEEMAKAGISDLENGDYQTTIKINL
jgi:hypothetical protein